MNRSAALAALALLWAAACSSPTGVDKTPVVRPTSPSGDVGAALAGAPPLKAPKPSLAITSACVMSTGELQVGLSWSNEQVVLNQTQVVSVLFKGPQGLTLSMEADVAVAPNVSIPTGNEMVTLIRILGSPPWNAFTTFGVSVSGYFGDVAPAVHQPKGGWPPCV